MKFKKLVLGVVTAFAFQTVAQAGVVYVGSWEVNDGPGWGFKPPAYSGQEAAALLFGGSAADYQISTISNDVLSIDNMAWYSILAVPGGHKFAENYSNKLPGGLYYDGIFSYTNNLGNMNNAASAYVNDNANGVEYTNYAFRVTNDVDVPEPASLALLGSALLGFGVLRRRRR